MDNLSNTSSDYVCNLPPKTSQFTERTFFFDKEYTIARQSSYHSLGTGDHRIIENTVEARRVRYYPRWSFIFMIIFLLLLIALLLFNDNIFSANLFNTTSPESAGVEETTLPPVDSLTNTEEILTYITTYVPLENGMIFPDSSSVIISDEKIQELQTKYDVKIYAVLIRMGVNELYAKYGYVFTVSPWNTYYDQQNWYKPNPQSNIDFSSFNETEVTNLYKLLQTEELITQ